MNDRCRVSEEEVYHDLDEMEASAIHDTVIREANRMIDNFDDITDLSNAVEFCGSSGMMKSLKEAIRSRDRSVSALIPILLDYYVMQGDA